MIHARKWLPLATALVSLSLTPPARADEAPTGPSDRRLTVAQRRANAEAAWHHHNFEYYGGLLLGNTYTMLRIDGRRAEPPAPLLAFGMEHALSYRVIRMKTTGVALTLLGRVTGFADDDRSLTHTDLALGPELRLLTRLVRPTIMWRFRVTGGYSWAFQNDREGRAVVESYSTGKGPNLGVALGVGWSGPRVGGYLQFGTFHRFLKLDAHTRLVDDPTVRATTRHEHTQSEVLFGGGWLVRF